MPLVLLVEDDPDDVHVIRRVLKRASIAVDLLNHSHGKEALRYLEACAQEKPGEGNRLPDLVLLDLNMPIMDGNQFLKAIRNHPKLTALPVCVFTTSTDKEVIRGAYEAGANAVVSKVD